MLLSVLLGWESLAPFLPLFQQGWRDRVRHALRNVAVALLNSGMTALAFATLWATAAGYAEQHSFGMANWAGLTGWPHAVATILLFDAWTYFWHRLNHRVPFFWRVHRTHHSDAKMDVTTASRFHLGEILITHLCSRYGTAFSAPSACARIRGRSVLAWRGLTARNSKPALAS